VCVCVPSNTRGRRCHFSFLGLEACCSSAAAPVLQRRPFAAAARPLEKRAAPFHARSLDFPQCPMSKKRTATSTPPAAPASAVQRARASDEPAPLQLEGLLPDLSSYIQLWLSQDIPSFDVQGCVAGSKRVTAHLLQKSPCILAGRPFFDAVFAQLGCRYVRGLMFCC